MSFPNGPNPANEDYKSSASAKWQLYKGLAHWKLLLKISEHVFRNDVSHEHSEAAADLMGILLTRLAADSNGEILLAHNAHCEGLLNGICAAALGIDESSSRGTRQSAASVLCVSRHYPSRIRLSSRLRARTTPLGALWMIKWRISLRLFHRACTKCYKENYLTCAPRSCARRVTLKGCPTRGGKAYRIFGQRPVFILQALPGADLVRDGAVRPSEGAFRGHRRLLSNADYLVLPVPPLHPVSHVVLLVHF